MVKWLELFVPLIIRAQEYWIYNLAVKTRGKFNVIPEASLLYVMLKGNIALPLLKNDAEPIVTSVVLKHPTASIAADTMVCD